MMQHTITVEAKVVGRRKPLFEDWTILLPPETQQPSGRMKLRDLIECVVRDEVEAFLLRQQQRRLVEVFTQAQIDQAAAQGKVDMGGRDLDQKVDAQQAVDTALQAFEDGLYFVFIDDAQQQSLDQDVYLQIKSRVTFIRLVALAGG